MESTRNAGRIDRINAEIRRILEDCSTAEKPLVQLTEHSLGLRHDPSWAPEDAEEVVNTALKFLLAILRPSDPDGSTVT